MLAMSRCCCASLHSSASSPQCDWRWHWHASSNLGWRSHRLRTNYCCVWLCRFVVLFAGTVIYSRGEDKSVEDSKEELQSAHPHLRWHGKL